MSDKELQYWSTKVKVNDKYSSKQNWIRQKKSKQTSSTKFAGTEKWIYIKYHMTWHA